MALYLGAVLGAGVLVLPGAVASAAGPASILAWALVCALSVPLALTFARLASLAPDPGGIASYASRAFGETAGALVGWFYFGAIAVGQGVVVLTGAYYLAEVADLTREGTFLVAGVFLTCATGANLAGLRFSGRLQLGLSGAVAVLLAIAIVAAIPRWSPDAFTPFASDGFVAVGRSAVTLLFAFFGWEAITHLSADFRDPNDIPRATKTALGIVALLYLGLALAVIGTQAQMVDEGRTAVADLLGAAVGTEAGLAAAIAATVITLATANTFIAAGGRLGYALARDGAFPDAFARRDVHATPVLAVGLVFLVSGASLVVAYLTAMGAADLVVVPSTLGLATYVIGTAAAMRILPAGERALPGCALGVCAAIAPFAAGGLLIPFIVGICAYLYLRSRQSRCAITDGSQLTPAFRRGEVK